MTADDAADIEAALRELAKHGRVFALRLESLADLIARAQLPGLTPRAVAWEQPDEMATTDGDECPGEHCPMCNGQACNLCGAGCWNSAPIDVCEHDVTQRHADAAEPPAESHPFAIAIPPAPPAVEEQTTLTDIVLARTGCNACAAVAAFGTTMRPHTCDPIPFGERQRPDGSAEPCGTCDGGQSTCPVCHPEEGDALYREHERRAGRLPVSGAPVAVEPGTVADAPREAPSFFEARAAVVANLAAAKPPRARKPAAPWEPSATSWQRAWASAHIFSADKAACVAAYLAACPTRHVKPGDRDFVRWVRETSGKMDAAKAVP